MQEVPENSEHEGGLSAGASQDSVFDLDSERGREGARSARPSQ